MRSREPPKMKLTTVRNLGSGSPALGSLMPRAARMEAMRSGMLRVWSMGQTLPERISKLRWARVRS